MELAASIVMALAICTSPAMDDCQVYVSENTYSSHRECETAIPEYEKSLFLEGHKYNYLVCVYDYEE